MKTSTAVMFGVSTVGALMVISLWLGVVGGKYPPLPDDAEDCRQCELCNEHQPE